MVLMTQAVYYLARQLDIAMDLPVTLRQRGDQGSGQCGRAHGVHDVAVLNQAPRMYLAAKC